MSPRVRDSAWHSMGAQYMSAGGRQREVGGQELQMLIIPLGGADRRRSVMKAMEGLVGIWKENGSQNTKGTGLWRQGISPN